MTKLWMLKRSDNVGYDEYHSAVVAAKTEGEAKLLHPSGNKVAVLEGNTFVWYWQAPEGAPLHGKKVEKVWDWPSPNLVQVEYLGHTERELSGVVLSYYISG